MALNCRLYAGVDADEDKQQVWDDYVGNRSEMGIFGGWCVGFGMGGAW